MTEGLGDVSDGLQRQDSSGDVIVSDTARRGRTSRQPGHGLPDYGQASPDTTPRQTTHNCTWCTFHAVFMAGESYFQDTLRSDFPTSVVGTSEKYNTASSAPVMYFCHGHASLCGPLRHSGFRPGIIPLDNHPTSPSSHYAIIPLDNSTTTDSPAVGLGVLASTRSSCSCRVLSRPGIAHTSSCCWASSCQVQHAELGKRFRDFLALQARSAFRDVWPSLPAGAPTSSVISSFFFECHLS